MRRLSLSRILIPSQRSRAGKSLRTGVVCWMLPNSGLRPIAVGLVFSPSARNTQLASHFSQEKTDEDSDCRQAF
jgi:hypothetical protein